MKISSKQRFIQVTGAPRSGTTFVGKMLALPQNVGYLKEPFNADFGMMNLPGHFIYLQDDPEVQYEEKRLVDDFMNGRAKFQRLPAKSREGWHVAGARQVFRSGSHFDYEKAKWLPWVNTYLVKDPTACLMAQYLHRTYDFQTIIMMRHPAAVVASFKRLGMRHELSDLLRQEGLKKYLEGEWWVEKTDRLSQIEQAAVLWRVLYRVMNDFAKHNPSMIVVKHEELSARPETTLRALYDRLGLQYNWGVGHTIRSYTADHNPVDPTGNRMHVLKRDSRSNIYRWKKVLTPTELLTVKSITEDVARHYYDEATWGMENQFFFASEPIRAMQSA